MYSNEKKPSVSIISVIFNQIEVTQDFLNCVERLNYPNLETIIVDNGSKINYREYLTKGYPFIKYIRSEKNLGFAGGNNLGIRHAKGDYFLLLNNDTEFENDIVERFLDSFKYNDCVGMVSPKIKFFNTNIIQFAGSSGINKYSGRGRTTGVNKKDDGKFNFVSVSKLGFGAAMMVPREVILNVCLMPDIYFLYYEEHDWCLKIKEQGYEIIYNGNIEVYHKESMSVGKESKLKTYFMSRNRLMFNRRNLSGLNFIFTSVFFWVISFPVNFLRYIIKRKFYLIVPYLKGIFWNFKHHNVQYSPILEGNIIRNKLSNRHIDNSYQC